MYKTRSELSNTTATTRIVSLSPQSINTSDSDNSIMSPVLRLRSSSLSVGYDLSSPGNLPSSPETCKKPECHSMRLR